MELNAVIALGLGGWIFELAPYILKGLLPTISTDFNILFAFKIAIIIYSLISINSVGYILLTLDPVKCMTTYLVSAFVSLTLTIVGAAKFGLIGALIGNIGFMLSWLKIGRRRVGKEC